MKCHAAILLRKVALLGLDERVSSGFRPAFVYQGERVSCVVESADAGQWISVGVEQQVLLDVPAAEVYGWKLAPGCRFELASASIVIGTGVVIEGAPAS